MANERWHGTVGGYANHKCRCDQCREAIRLQQRAYRQREDIKAKRRAYFQREDIKAKQRAYMRAYRQREDVEAKRRAYFQREDIKAKRRAKYAEERRLIALARQMEAQAGQRKVG